MVNKKENKDEVEKLVFKAQNGDVDAFGDIYDLYVDRIYKYIYFRVDKEDALDLTENVFLKVWENLNSYKKVKNKYFSSWLYRIAHNIVVDFYRFNKETVDISDLSLADQKKSNDPIVLTQHSLNQDVLKKALSKLNKRYRQIILLKFINDLDNKEISVIMKRSEGGLRILQFRALRALRRVLEDMNVKY